jgi:hypothetical protein
MADSWSKLKISFDEVTGAMRIAGQQTVSLQKQVRLLRQELTLGSYTDAQFKQIQQALQETELQLKEAQLRGKNLFEQVGTIGGPFGELSNRIDRTLKLLNALSEMSFDELKQQFRTLGALFGFIRPEDISQAIDVQQTGGRPAGVKESSGNAGEVGTGLLGAAEIAQQAEVAKSVTKTKDAIDLQTKALLLNNTTVGANVGAWQRGTESISQYMNRTLEMRMVLDEIETKFETVNTVIEDGVAKIGINDMALRALTDAEIAAVKSGEMLIITEEGLIATQQKATIWTRILTAATSAYGLVVKTVSAFIQVNFVTAIRTADIAAKILVGTLSILGAALAAIFVGAQWIGGLYQTITGFAKMNAEAENLGTQIGNIKKILDMDLADLKRRNAERVAEMKKNNLTSEQIRQEELKGLKEYYNATTLALEDARKKYDKANRDIANKGGLFGISDEAAEEMTKNVKEAGDLVLALEKEQKDAANEINVKGNANIEATTKESIQNRIKELDSYIENEIYSENTRTKELQKLYKERNQLTEYLDKDHKLKQSEIDERDRTQRLKINNAIIDDEVRRSDSKIKILEAELLATTKDTEREFEIRREIAAENMKKEMEEAKRDERTRTQNERAARTKNYLALREIEKNELEARKNLNQSYYNAAAQDSTQFFNLEKQLLEDELAIQLKIYENNEKMKLALKEEYAKKQREVDAKQLDAQGNLEQRRADTEWQSQDNRGKVGLKWLISHNNKVREINDLVYADKITAEEKRYEADKLRAQGNAELLEVIEREHGKNLLDLRAEQVETNQQLNQMMFQTAIQFGETLGQLGDLLLSRAQGRNKKQFENAKKLAIAAVVIEKAAAIGQIWSNNAIANAKATATFWATGGQPWVTINTIQAGLSTAATVISATKAIQEINGKQFEPAPTSMGKNYEKGGMIGGNRHYEGGTMIEAEQGEAIMSRGAVTMFAPLLSTLNQMGGGTAFSRGAVGQAGYDNPDFNLNNNNNTPSQIIKTYVVENELTSVQEKQARLRNLSIL